MQLEEGERRSIKLLAKVPPLKVNIIDWSNVNQNIAGGIRWLFGKGSQVEWCKLEKILGIKIIFM